MSGKLRIFACALMLVGGATFAGCGERPADGSCAEKADADSAVVAPSAGRAPDAERAATEPESSQAANARFKQGVKKIVVYYFHRTLRCKTCLAIESQAKEAVERDFAEALKQGRIEWRAVDIDQAANKHFEKEFKLESSSVVLVETIDGTTARWKDLPRVWDLVAKKEAFCKYVSGEVALYLR